jgi:hypothetical protein
MGALVRIQYLPPSLVTVELNIFYTELYHEKLFLFNCNKEHLFKGHSYANKYCDNKCQQEFQYKQYITDGNKGYKMGEKVNCKLADISIVTY